MDLPLVTVGVASFNNASYLRETLESIRLQTYAHIEVIIVDDASRDDSVMVAKAWLAEHPDVDGRLICHEANLGVCRVCNGIVTQGRGEFISIIGSDDVFLSDKLSRQVALMLQAPPEVGVVFGDNGHMDSTGKSIPTPTDVAPMHTGNVFLALLKANFVPATSTLVRRSCYEKVGLYDENLNYEDWDIWLRIAREFEFLYVPRVEAIYRVHNKSATYTRRLQIEESSLVLLCKHLDYSVEGDKIIHRHVRQLSESIYQLGSTNAHGWLKKAHSHSSDKRTFALLLLSTLRIEAEKVRRIKSLIRSARNLLDFFLAYIYKINKL